MGCRKSLQQELIENWDEDALEIGGGKLKDRNRTTILEEGVGVQVERQPQFDVRGWRFDACTALRWTDHGEPAEG